MEKTEFEKRIDAQQELIRHIFAIQKYFQEMNHFDFTKGNEAVYIDSIGFTLEYIKDLLTQVEYIKTRLELLANFIDLNSQEKI